MPWTRIADVGQLRGLLLEHADELLADDLPLALGVVDAGEPGEEALLRLDVDQVDAELAHRGDDLLGLVLAHQPVVDEHAGELVADRAMDERRRGRRVDPARQPADHAGVADLRPDPLDLLVDHRGRRPGLDAAGDLAQEAVEDLLAVGRVDDLGMELDPVQAALRVLAGGHRRARAGGERLESGRRLEDRVAVAHPARLLGRQPGEQPAAVTGEGELGAAELAGLGALDAAAERPDHRLHPVTDAEHRDPELEQLAAQLGGALGVDRGRAAREHQRARRALADRLERRCRAEAAPRRRRTRGSAARSAASTGRRSRAPAPPRARSPASRYARGPARRQRLRPGGPRAAVATLRDRGASRLSHR